jgi:hypothetical protein
MATTKLGGVARPLLPLAGRPAALRRLLPLTLLACVAIGCGSAAAATLTRGFADDVWFDSVGKSWVARTAATGARTVSLEIDWSDAQPKAPSKGTHPASPRDPQYNYGYIDGVLRKFEGTRIEPMLLITDAPRWAQAAGGTAAEYADGSYEPNDGALQSFVEALARRYSGTFPDPLHRGRKLPQVRYFQAWAEANMGIHMSPQWVRAGNGWANPSPLIYRRLLNAFYAGVKAGNPKAQVVFTGLESYGDAPGGRRTSPVTFLRSVLCLNTALVKQPCADPAHFDILASDPYEVGSPNTPALSADDASAPDLAKLKRVMNAAIAAHTVVPAASKPLWVTEFGYESNPPNRTAGTPSLGTQARWLDESFYLFWRQGVSSVMWYLIRDQTGSFATHYFSGIYFHDGRAKPALTAYRFPLAVMPNGNSGQVWGIAPATGKVAVQRRAGKGWVTVFSVRANAGSVFTGSVALTATGQYRAVESKQSSLAWNFTGR